MASRVYGHQKQKVTPSASSRPRTLTKAQSASSQAVTATPNRHIARARRQQPEVQGLGTTSAVHRGMAAGALFATAQDALNGLRTAVMDSFSELLFARPSFLEGMARLFDFGNTLSEYNNSLTPEQADRLAIASDWRAIGLDMRHAMDEFASQHGDKRAS